MSRKQHFFLDTPTFIRRMFFVVVGTTLLFLLSCLIVFLISGDLPSMDFLWKPWAFFIVVGAVRPTYLYLHERFYYDDDDDFKP